jgi:hypothetical protein
LVSDLSFEAWDKDIQRRYFTRLAEYLSSAGAVTSTNRNSAAIACHAEPL